MAYGNYLLPWNLNHIAKGHVAETQAKNVCRIFAMWSKTAKPHKGVSSFPNQYTLNTIANRVDPIMRETARGIALTSVYDEMLARRELSVIGAIDSAMAFDICQQLLQLEHEDASAEIALFVASPAAASPPASPSWTPCAPSRARCAPCASIPSRPWGRSSSSRATAARCSRTPSS